MVTVQSGPRPALLFDYYGFPEHTYKLTWPAHGAPTVAKRIRELLSGAGIQNQEDSKRGFDHGAFIPLKVAYPDAQIPTLQISLNANLDPSTHLALGHALAPLRDEGVLLIGSGMSFHNMGAMMRPGTALDASLRFDAWLEEACKELGAERELKLANWARAPEGRYCHPREEHLLPLLVVAGAARGEPGEMIFRDQVMGAQVSAFQFGA